MTVLHLDDQVAAVLKDRARAKGLSLDEYLQAIALMDNMMVSPAADSNDAREFDAALDELFAADTRKLPTSSDSYSRQDIYINHD